ncbi:MAG: hypothetical protein FWE04_04750 [Oscillospiraceae bacterium]|nr:hypothetical protein [Oscillospiraceae bacterium]
MKLNKRLVIITVLMMAAVLIASIVFLNSDLADRIDDWHMQNMQERQEAVN